MDGNSIFVRSEKFPVLPGEEDELVNPGTFGRSLAEFMQSELQKHDYDVPFVVCEDFGWWIEVKLPPVSEGITCIRSHAQEGSADFYISIAFRDRRWSWRRLRLVDIGEQTKQLRETIREIFDKHPDIEVLPDDYDGHFDYFGSEFEEVVSSK